MKVMISLIGKIYNTSAYIQGVVELLKRQVIYQTLTILCLNLGNL